MTMLNTLYNMGDRATGYEGSRYPLTLGIEVELERVVFNEPAMSDPEDDIEDYVGRYGEPTTLHDYWTLHEDGSLRNGIEFTFNGPIIGDEVTYAVSNLFDAMDRFDPNPRCSTHIHVGAEALSVENLQAFIAVMAAVEEGIYNMTTPDRKWCGYAMPITAMNNTRLAQLFSQDNARMVEALDSRNRRQERYYGCNLLSLRKFGTIEFRYFQGVSGKEELLKWADLVTQVMKAATTLTWDKLFQATQSQQQLATLLQEFLGSFYTEVTSYLDMNEVSDILENMLALTEMRDNLVRSEPLVFYSPMLSNFMTKSYCDTKTGRARFESWFSSVKVATPNEILYQAQQCRHVEDGLEEVTHNDYIVPMSSTPQQSSESERSPRRWTVNTSASLFDEPLYATPNMEEVHRMYRQLGQRNAEASRTNGRNNNEEQF